MFCYFTFGHCFIFVNLIVFIYSLIIPDSTPFSPQRSIILPDHLCRAHYFSSKFYIPFSVHFHFLWELFIPLDKGVFCKTTFVVLWKQFLLLKLNNTNQM